jgi:hypothetical protein
MGSAATSVAVVLLLREATVRVGPAPSLRAVLPSNREAAGLAVLLLLGYLVLGFGMRRGSVPPVWPGQVSVWVMYAVVVGLYVVAVRRTRTLPSVLVAPHDPPARRPLVTLGIVFTVAAFAASFFPAATPVVDVAILILGTLTCAIWLVGVLVRTLIGPAR